MRSWSWVVLVGLVLVGGCNSRMVGDDEIAGSVTTNSTETTTDTETTDPTETTTETTETTSDTGMAECGNAILEFDEACDDGNLVAGDGCSPTCQIERATAIPCGNKGPILSCGDTIDNDQDGLVDLDDPECVTPCDDDEGSFQANKPGADVECKVDCYFDSNTGQGDDLCEWNIVCDPLNPGANIGCAYDPDFGNCPLDVEQDCRDFCEPVVPNGCDCFGCCEVEGTFIYLESPDEGCSLANLGACETCTFFANCNNPCMPEACELCFGQSPEDLQPGCGAPSCPIGVIPCESIADCAVEQFCQTGCCVAIEPA